MLLLNYWYLMVAMLFLSIFSGFLIKLKFEGIPLKIGFRFFLISMIIVPQLPIIQYKAIRRSSEELLAEAYKRKDFNKDEIVKIRKSLDSRFKLLLIVHVNFFKNNQLYLEDHMNLLIKIYNKKAVEKNSEENQIDENENSVATTLYISKDEIKDFEMNDKPNGLTEMVSSSIRDLLISKTKSSFLKKLA
ncbi:hypothetical protein [Guptibacillus hwajinpoensis]|uniref:hypothetical protein n=1 Tax=Guptibacillus hwajinpoensis TaxID=208199 RepID=UPI00273BFEFD|nr:hypothetical protein [Alkalihalobacillus macyae]